MKRIFYFSALFFFLFISKPMFSQVLEDHNYNTIQITVNTVTFPSKDSLLVTADYYQVKPQKSFALLCHQARFSRGEYRKTTPWLCSKGISCLAIDQRSGNEVNGILNETAKRARKKGLRTDYLDAKQDIESAIDFAYKRNNKQPILLVGSSYSASLALLIGATNKKVKAIAVFSPGEYLEGISLSKEIKGINKPVFVTAAKNEIPAVKKLLQNVNPKYITLFEPDVNGFHGSKALWSSKKGHEAYQKAFTDWLKKYDFAH